MQTLSDLTTVQTAVREGRSPKAAELMRLPARYRGKGLIPGKLSEMGLEAVRKGESLFLTGKQGSGKTHLAIALMGCWYSETLALHENKIYPMKGAPVFLPVVELLLEIKNSWREQEDKRTESEMEVLNKYSRCPFLVLDDLGAEKMSEWSRTVFYLLLDRRYRDMKQTIITSNLTQGQIATEFDARVASRISEMGVCLNLGDKDWRLASGRKALGE